MPDIMPRFGNPFRQAPFSKTCIDLTSRTLSSISRFMFKFDEQLNVFSQFARGAHACTSIDRVMHRTQDQEEEIFAYLFHEATIPPHFPADIHARTSSPPHYWLFDSLSLLSLSPLSPPLSLSNFKIVGRRTTSSQCGLITYLLLGGLRSRKPKRRFENEDTKCNEPWALKLGCFFGHLHKREKFGNLTLLNL